MHCRRAGHDGDDSTDAEASVSSLWPMVFDGGFRFREADAETDGKCHRGQAREGAAGAGRTEDRAGDKGLSGSGTAVTKHICPYNLAADDGESVGFMECSGCGTE